MTTYATEQVKVRWYCGGYFGPARWSGDYMEPEECGHTFSTQESVSDWKANGCHTVCPRCKTVLTQAYDRPDLVWPS